MKILLVLSNLGVGGAERTAAEISRVLDKHYHTTVLIFHDRVTYPHGGKLINLLLPYNHRPTFAQKCSRLYKKWTGFRRVFHQERPDVVLSVTEGPNIIVLLNKIMGLRATFITNTQVPPSYVYRGVYKYFYAVLIRALYRHADCIVALSEGVKGDLVTHFGAAAERVQVVYNAVDCQAVQTLSAESVEEALFADDRPVVLNVGRLMPQKNQTLLLRAFRRVRDRVAARLVLVGSGQLESELRRLASSLGVEADVSFLGWQQNPFKYMRRASVFVLSSDFEGFGNVVIEAMACGCPVVATDCPWGPAEILTGGEYGMLVPVGNEALLAEAILRVLSDEGLRQTLIEKGRRRAQDFDTRVMARRYTEIFASLRTPA